MGVGRPTRRLDGLEKVRGSVRYVEDVHLPGMLHARLLLSPHAHALIKRISDERTLHVPGVVAVLTAEHLPLAPGVTARRMLARGEVRYAGQAVAVVLADSEAAAADGVEILSGDVEYEPLPAVLDVLEAVREGAPVVAVAAQGDSEAASHSVISAGSSTATSGNVVARQRFIRGDVAEGFRDAEIIVEGTYSTNRVYQGYLEPQATVATIDPATRVITLYTSTQAPFFVREQTARALGVPEHAVRVVPMAVGGAFGGKILLLQPLTAALAVTTMRPVRLVLPRRDDFMIAAHAPASNIEVRLGARRNGTLVALQARVILEAGASPGAPAATAANLLGGYYRIPHLDVEANEVLTNKPPVGAYRAPGAPQATFAIESHMDVLARELGLDPLELRLKNAVEEGDPMPNGRPWPRIGLRRVLEAVRSQPKWQCRDSGNGIGYGLAVGGWLGGLEPASACVRANPDGTFHILVGAADITGTATTMAMIAAETLSLPLDQVRVITGDTDQAPYAGSASGSKITYTVGAAVKRAAEDARRQILAIAANELEARVDDLELADGEIFVKGSRERAISLAAITKASMAFGGRYPPIFGTASVQIPSPSPGFAAHLAKVHVDLETGCICLLNYLVIQDVGFAINPPAVVGQMRGGIAQGIGWALFESVTYDDNGTLLTSTLSDYAIPRATDVPNVEAQILEVPSEFGPFGAKGVGEPPVVAGAAALANAIAGACGVRLSRLPITSADVAAAVSNSTS